MVNKDLIDYIRSESNRGVSKAVIRDMLIKSGWQVADVDEGESIVFATPVVPPAPQPIVQPMSTFTQPNVQATPVTQTTPIQKPNLASALDAYKQKATTQPFSPSKPTFKPAEFVSPTFGAGASTAAATAEAASVESVTIHSPTPTMHINTVRGVETISYKPTKSYGKIIAVFVILLIILGGGAVYGYFAGYFTTSAALGTEMASAYGQVNGGSFTTNAHVELATAPDNSNFLGMLPGFSSSLDIAASGTISKDADHNTSLNSTATITAGSIDAEASVRLVNSMLFIKTTKAPSVPFFDTYQSQWLSVPIDPVTFGMLGENATNRLTITKRFPPTRINGVTMYHIAFSVLTSDIPSINSLSGEAWIGQQDKLPYKIMATIATTAGSISTSTEFTDWNSGAKVDAPAESLPFDAYIENSMKNAGEAAFDESVRNSISSLQKDAEDYFANASLSYKNFCSSPSVLESQAVVTCKDTASAYILFSKLSDTTGGYACTDSAGTTVDLLKAPKGMLCK